MTNHAFVVEIGLGFKEQQRGAFLYIATTAKVLLYNTVYKSTQV